MNHVNKTNNNPITTATIPTAAITTAIHPSRRLSALFRHMGVSQANMHVSPLISSADSPERRTIIDVGSNNGDDYSLNSLKKHHKVYSFEPMPPIWQEFKNTMVHFLDKVIEIPVIPGEKAVFPMDHQAVRSDRLYFIHAAASDRTAKLSVPNRGLMTSIIDQTFFNNPGGAMIDIATVVIDDYIDEDIFLFKTDTQGHEYSVLKGAEKLLKTRKVSYLTLEFWPAAIRNSGADPLELLNFIYDLGFSCSDISNNMHKGERHTPLSRSGDFIEYVQLLDRIPPAGDFIGLWDELFCWRDT